MLPKDHRTSLLAEQESGFWGTIQILAQPTEFPDPNSKL